MDSDSRHKSYSYDCADRIPGEPEKSETWTTHYDSYGRVIVPGAPPLPAPSDPLPPPEPICRLFSHTFELRLAGSEEKRSSTFLAKIPPGDRLLVTIDQVRTFVTRGGEPAAASNLIGGVEVRTERHPATSERPERLVCIAQASDFGAAASKGVRTQIGLTDGPTVGKLCGSWADRFALPWVGMFTMSSIGAMAGVPFSSRMATTKRLSGYSAKPWSTFRACGCSRTR